MHLPQVKREQHVVVHEGLTEGCNLRVANLGRREDQRLEGTNIVNPCL